tara:strand:- start:847 stop:978 length:132 start_codon:yes stop_codon:yes gene_type:complete
MHRCEVCFRREEETILDTVHKAVHVLAPLLLNQTLKYTLRQIE